MNHIIKTHKTGSARRVRVLVYCLLPVLVLLIVGMVVKQSGYGISYQFSQSMPEGLYVYHPIHAHLHHDETVLFVPPTWAEAYLLEHGWLHPSMYMMKQLMGVPGDRFCVRDHAVYINQHRIAPVLDNYAPGKPLPHLHYCQTLPKDQYVLMSTHIERSFDARYFGPVARQNIVDQAQPLVVFS